MPRQLFGLFPEMSWRPKLFYGLGGPGGRAVCQPTGSILSNYWLTVKDTRAQQAELAALEERHRVAREIHDGIAQSIYMLSISLEACVDLASQGQNGLQERLRSLVQISKQALLDTRHYIFDLKPMLEGNRPITEMVEHQLQEFRTVTSIPTAFTVSGIEATLPLSASAGLYRIVQEGLANVFRHAQASQVEVHLAFNEEKVQLQIRDDGKGFNTTNGPSGYGLGNMAQRARELGGELNIESSPGHGTCLTLTLPVAKDASMQARTGGTGAQHDHYQDTGS
jgi:signal transduction histidine kinase